MENLMLTISIVLPIFLVMVAGYISRQTGLVDGNGVAAVNKLVFRVFLPVSLAKSLMSVDRNAPMDMSVMLFCVVSTLAIFGVSWLVFSRTVPEDKRRGVMIQALFRGNYAIFGIPLAEALFPQGDGGVAAMMTIATVPVFNVLAVITLEWFRGGRCSLQKVLKGIATNPLLWGCGIGFLVMILGIRLPEFAQSTVNKLASVASPLALFALGASVDLKKLRGNAGIVTAGSVARLVLVPLAVLLPAFLLGYRGPAFGALLVAFASPCAVSSYTMAEQMGADGDLAGQLVMATTVFSAFSIFVLVFLCKSFAIL